MEGSAVATAPGETDPSQSPEGRTKKAATSSRQPSAAPVFEDGRVTVCVRERPFLRRELASYKHAPAQQAVLPDRDESCEPNTLSDSGDATRSHCLQFADDGETVRIAEPVQNVDGTTTINTGAAHTFRFDHAYPMATAQETLYRDMGVPVLDATFRGFNTCIFAYGQTGSGKSYSMMGADGGADIATDPGLVPRLCEGLFARIASLTAVDVPRTSSTATRVEVVVRVSYLEIYQEKVRSLLNDPIHAAAAATPGRESPTSAKPRKGTEKGARRPNTSDAAQTLRVRQHPTLGVFVEGLQEIPVTSHEQILHWMRIGNLHRRTAATRMNDVSSRSHAIFALQVVQKRSTRLSDGRVQVTERRAKVNLVDLAGSERVRSTGAAGDILKEGAHINLSLTTLGRVIKALAEMSSASTAIPGASPGAGPQQQQQQQQQPARHIPYRDSTLTFLLQESLGGSSKTYMLATLSPAGQNYDETLSTLRYADRAKSIVTRAFVNESASDKRIRELEEEVQRLRDQIAQLQTSGMRAGQSASLERALAQLGAMASHNADDFSPAARAPANAEDDTLMMMSSDSDEAHAHVRSSRTSTRTVTPRTHSSSADTPADADDDEDEDAAVPERATAAPPNVRTPSEANDDGEASDTPDDVSGAPVHPAAALFQTEEEEEGGEEEAQKEDTADNVSDVPVSSPLTAQVEQLQSALGQAEEIIRQLTESDKERAAEIAAAAAAAVESLRLEQEDENRRRDAERQAEHAALRAQMEALKAARTKAGTVAHRHAAHVPYLLNVDGVGDWLVAYLDASHPTYVGLADAEADSTNADGSVYLAVPASHAEGVVKAHLCFHTSPADGTVRVTTAQADPSTGEAALVSLNGQSPQAFPSPPPGPDHVSDVQAYGTVLHSGDVLRIGAAQLTLRFIDPSAPLSNTRRPDPLLFPTVVSPTSETESMAEAPTLTVPGPDSPRSHSPLPEARVPSPPPPGVRTPTVTTIPDVDDDSEEEEKEVRMEREDVPSEDDQMTGAAAQALAEPGAVVIPKLALSSIRPLGSGQYMLPFASNGGGTNAPVYTTPATRDHSPTLTFASPGVAPVSTLPLTARGTRRQEDFLSGPFRGPAGQTLSGLSHGSSSTTTNTAALSRGAVLSNEPARFVGQHTFCFVGAPGSGKTCTRENLRQPDKWYGFLVKTALTYPPTWGVERVALDVDGQEDMRLILTELSGQPCFTMLADFIPWRRVTFVLCFSLEHHPSIQDVRQTVEMLLCHTDRRPIALLLVATHMDKSHLEPAALKRLLEELEGEVRNLCVMLQPNPDLRPVVIGRAAVNNTTREVIMSGFAKVDTFPKLLAWLSDYAYHQCRNDPDFPNGIIPERCLQLRHHLMRMRLSRKFCLSARDYRSFAASLYPREYGGQNGAAGRQGGSDLALHTQLLTSWGVVLHLDGNARWRPYVLLDVQWLHLILAVIASLGRTAPTPEEEEAATRDACEASLQLHNDDMTYRLHSTNAGSATASAGPPVQGSILLSSMTMRRLMRHSSGTQIPFSPQKVITADSFGLLRHSIPTVPVLEVLMEKLIMQHSDTTARHLAGIVEVLENCDVIIRGSRLLYSPTQRRYRLLRSANSASKGRRDDNGGEDGISGGEDEDDDGDDEAVAVWTAAQQREFFFLLPSTFTAPAPPRVVQHFSKFLSGPFYRFKFNVIPPLFFSKLVSRLVSPTVCASLDTRTDTASHQPQRKVYMGPLDPVMVETASLSTVLDSGARTTTTASCSRGSPQRVIIPSGHLNLWATCAWIAADGDDDSADAAARSTTLSTTPDSCDSHLAAALFRPSRSRVLLRLVHHSLFLSFHNVYETVYAARPPPDRVARSVFADMLSSTAESFADDELDYDDDLHIDASLDSHGRETPASALAVQLRDVAFFQGVLDTVRGLAEEYPGTRCEESILSTTSSAPASYTEPWLEEKADSQSASVPPPQYHTVDVNLNSLERVEARRQASLMTARTHSTQGVLNALREFATENEDNEAADVFPYLRAHTPRHAHASHVDDQDDTDAIPTERVRAVLDAVQNTTTTNALNPSDASLQEVLVALNDALAAEDAVRNSQVVDALLDVLSRQ